MPPRSVACLGADASSASYRNGERSTTYTPSGNALATSPATSMASRVLPVPPAPCRVSRRVASLLGRSRIQRTSALRPTNGPGWAGKPPPLTGVGVSKESGLAPVALSEVDPPGAWTDSHDEETPSGKVSPRSHSTPLADNSIRVQGRDRYADPSAARASRRRAGPLARSQPVGYAVGCAGWAWR